MSLHVTNIVGLQRLCFYNGIALQYYCGVYVPGTKEQCPQICPYFQFTFASINTSTSSSCIINMEDFDRLIALITPKNKREKKLLQAIVEYINAQLLVEVVKYQIAIEEAKPRRARRYWV